MKKFLVIVLLAFVVLLGSSVRISAQERGLGAVGAQLTGGFGDNLANFGVGAKLQLNFLEPLRIEGSVNGFIRNKNVSMFDANLNLHWMAFLTRQFCVYPLVGAGYHLTTLLEPDTKFGGLETDDLNKTLSDWQVCANIGGGLDFYLTDVVILNFEAKYKYLKHVNIASRINLSVGIAYLF